MRWLRSATQWVAVGGFILGGLVSGVVAWRLASGLEHERVWALCSGRVSELAADLLHATRELSSELFHVRSFFEAQPEVTRRQFQLYTKEVLESHPAIQAVEWAPRVSARQRESHERRAVGEGVPDYRIVALGPAGALVEAPPKEEYYPVVYAEPPGPNLTAFGFDLSSDRTQNAALTRALETRTVSFTEPVDLVQDAGVSRGLLAMLPAYRGGSESDRAGRYDPDGVILLVIRLQDLLDPSLTRLGTSGAVPMKLDVIDETAGSRPVTVGSVSGASEGLQLASSAYEESLEVGGRRWKLVGRPTQAFLTRHLTRWPVALGTGVFLFWETAGGLALLLLTRWRDKTLRTQARVYQAAVQNLAEGIIVADSRGRFILFNPAAERILGIGQEDVGVEEWSATYGCFYPDTRTPFPPEQLPLARALRGEEAQEELFIRNRLIPDGVWISVSGAPLRDERGNLDGGVVVFRDITDWKKSSQTLLRLSSVVEQTADTVFITNRDGVIDYVNPAFEVTTGYSRLEAVGQTPRILKSGQTSPQQYAELWKTILAGETFRAHIVNRKKSGELYHAEQTITPVKASDGSVAYFVAVVKDMTDRFRRQAQEIEMGHASRIQQKLYPAEAPRVAGYDIAGAAFPAEATCGDYFDYVPLADSGLGLVIGDVCGHGLGPALIMAATRSYVRFLSNIHASPDQVFEIINDSLFSDLESGDYVAMVLVRLDIGSNRFSCANAGHLSSYHLDSDGGVKNVLSSTGTPLGMFPSQKYGCHENLTLEPGDLVVMFTDGISEAEDDAGNVFGIENALSVIRAHRHEPAAQIVQCLCRAVRDFVGAAPQHDDMTLVVCKGGSPA